jgi:hypothetical protein
MKKSLSILMLFTIVFIGKTIAQTATVPSGATVNWSDVSIWTPGIPNSGNNVTINFSGGGTLVIDVSTTVGALNITNSSITNRSSVIADFPLTVSGTFDIGTGVDFKLGATLGNSTSPLVCDGVVTVAASTVTTRPYTGGGLYCNDNVISGLGNLTMGAYSNLGIGSAFGVEGNITIPATYTDEGNYIFNGTVNQATGFSMRQTANDITIDNAGTVTLNLEQIVNGINQLKQGVFDIFNNKIIYNGLGKIEVVVGKIKAFEGTIEMRGNEFNVNTSNYVAQNLSGNWFVDNTIANLVNSNKKGVTVAGGAALPLLITNSLKYGKDAFVADIINSRITTNDNLTLVSGPLATASFGVKAPTNSIQGKVSVERYMPAIKAWRLLSTPIQALGSPSVKDSWQEGNNSSTLTTLLSTGRGTRVTGPATSLGMNMVSQRGSMKRYNQFPIGVPDDFIFVTNTANPIATDDGYFLFVRGDMGVGQYDAANPTILRMKGNLRTGDVTVTSSNPAIGFQSVGNPYASRVDFHKSTKINMADAFHVWTPNLIGFYGVGAYESFVWIVDPADPIQGGYYQNATTGEIKNFLESGQAVIVENNLVGTSSVTFHETDKADGSTNVSRPPFAVTPRPSMWIRMAKGDVNNTNPITPITVANGSAYYSDGVFVHFDNAYSLAMNNDDVREIFNPTDNMSIKRGNYFLVADRRPTLQNLDTIFLNINNFTQVNLSYVTLPTYRFEISSVLANTYPGLDARLKDSYTGIETPLRIDGITQYIFTTNADPASKVANRFMIVFRNGNTVLAGRAAISNIANTVVENATNAVTTATAQPTFAKKIEDEKTIPTKTGIAVYPNIVTNGEVNLRLENQPIGIYQLQVINQQGQVLKTASINLQTNNLLQTINIGNAAAGSYQILITDKAANKKAIGFVVN